MSWAEGREAAMPAGNCTVKPDSCDRPRSLHYSNMHRVFRKLLPRVGQRAVLQALVLRIARHSQQGLPLAVSWSHTAVVCLEVRVLFCHPLYHE